MTRALPRSILYTPALSLDRVLTARSYDADIHLIDLEDSVPPRLKAEGRKICRTALERATDTSTMAVRVNPLDSVELMHDLASLLAAPARPDYVFMTMVRFAAEPVLLRDMLASAGWRPQIFVTVETVEAVAEVDSVAAASDGLILGSADLAATLGIDINWTGMLAARQAMALASARHGCACIDTGNFRLDDRNALSDELGQVRQLGFHGKGTVHPKELDAINKAFGFDEADLAAAQRVLDVVSASGDGVAMFDGNMVGPPFVRRARQMIEANRAWEARFGPGRFRTTVEKP